MASHAIKRLLSITLIVSAMPLGMACMTIPQSAKPEQKDRLLIPFIDLAHLGMPDHPLCEVDVVYPQTLLESEIEALLLADYEVTTDPPYITIHSIKSYEMSPRLVPNGRVSFMPFDMEKSDIDLKEMEEEVRSALRRKILDMKQTQNMQQRDQRSYFYFLKDKVYARTIIPAAPAAVFQAASEVIQSSDLEIESSDPEEGIIQTKSTGGAKDGEKSDFFFIFKFTKTPDENTEAKVVLVLKRYYSPFDGSRKVFTISFPYSKTLIYLLNRTSAKLGVEGSIVEFINSSHSIRDIFSFEKWKIRDIRKMEHEISSNMKPPKLIKRVEPDFPSIARRYHFQGEVLLATVIGKNGKIQDIEILQAIPKGIGLEESAAKAVSQWEYEPATLDGNPVSVYATVSVIFTGL